MIEDQHLHLLINEEIFIFDSNQKQTDEVIHDLVILTNPISEIEKDNLQKILQSVNTDISDAHIVNDQFDKRLKFKKLIAFGRKNDIENLCGSQITENEMMLAMNGGEVFYTKSMKELIQLSKDEKLLFYTPFKQWLTS